MSRRAYLAIAVAAGGGAAALASAWAGQPYGGGPAPSGGAAPGYQLPLDVESASNWDDVSYMVGGGDALHKMRENGFVVMGGSGVELQVPAQLEFIDAPDGGPPRAYDSMAGYYGQLARSEVPTFVTSDSVLDVHHSVFSDLLKAAETGYFYEDMAYVSAAMFRHSLAQHDDLDHPMLKEAALRNAAFFAVGLDLLGSPADLAGGAFAGAGMDKVVDAELSLIRSAATTFRSPLFGIQMDYTQYVPRGHYTQSPELGRYFVAMSWYSEASFDPPDESAPLTDHVKTAQAVLLSSALLGDERAYDGWRRVYDATSLLVGPSDDPEPRHYVGAYQAAGGTGPASFLDGAVRGKFYALLDALPRPRIVSGSGACGNPEGPPAQALGHEGACLEESPGMRFMGKRFVPDSYAMSELTGDRYEYRGDGDPFTLVRSEVQPLEFRGFPRGLDVMSVLGSDRAADILREYGDAEYEHYVDRAGALRQEFAAAGGGQAATVYQLWLESLAALLDPAPAGHPAFMSTKAWQDKDLHTALSSWAQLRHDTILYAKPSHTDGMLTGSIAEPDPPEPPPGYVEPADGLYRGLLNVSREAEGALDRVGVLGEDGRSRLGQMISMLERLLAISEAQARGERLADRDYKYIREFGRHLSGISPGIDSTVMIADVHTATNTVLQVGTGHIRVMVVAYEAPGGDVVLGAGPVLSYYEFKHPRPDRLTDDAWAAMLLDDAPRRPAWTDSFVAGSES